MLGTVTSCDDFVTWRGEFSIKNGFVNFSFTKHHDIRTGSLREVSELSFPRSNAVDVTYHYSEVICAFTTGVNKAVACCTASVTRVRVRGPSTDSRGPFCLGHRTAAEKRWSGAEAGRRRQGENRIVAWNIWQNFIAIGSVQIILIQQRWIVNRLAFKTVPCNIVS